MPGRYNARRAAAIKARLVAQLGGRCAYCGRAGHTEFDHSVPIHTRRRSMGNYSRLVALRREAARGQIQLLCRDCHAAKEAQDWVLNHLPAADRSDQAAPGPVAKNDAPRFDMSGPDSPPRYPDTPGSYP